MKKILFIAALFASVALPAQKIEVSLQPQTGLYSFRGPGAFETGTYFIADVLQPSTAPRSIPGYFSGFSFSLESAVQRVGKKKWIQGLGISYESLQSKYDIKGLANVWGPFTEVSGESRSTNKYVTLHPYYGRRLQSNKLRLDISLGIDFAIGLEAMEKGEFKGNTGETYRFNYYRNTPPTDIRLRIQFIGRYKKIGILLAYSHGISDYNYGATYSGPLGAPAFSQYLRTGISYKLK